MLKTISASSVDLETDFGKVQLKLEIWVILAYFHVEIPKDLDFDQKSKTLKISISQGPYLLRQLIFSTPD